jgi:cobalt-zinc-cadmium efflux system protein
MGHDHHHHHQHGHHHHHAVSGEAGGRLLFAFLINVIFAVIELVGGVMTNSVSILSNALHDFGDAFSLGASWYLERVAKQKGDGQYSYGYRRFSVLGAVVNSLILVGGSLLILTQSVPRIFHPEAVSIGGMAGFAVVGIVANLLAAWRLSQGSSLNEKVVSWHLIEDVLGWVAVLIVSLAMRFWNVPILDPILSILITLFVFYNVLGRFRETLRVFLQAVPAAVEIAEIERHILTTPQVTSVHHTRLWTLDGESHILTTHVVLASGANQEHAIVVKREIKHHLREFAIHDVTIEIEFAAEVCASSDLP